VNAKRRIVYLKSLLKDIGLEPDRVQMYHISSAQAVQFAQAAAEMHDRITALGPNPLRIPRKSIENHEPPNE
jgi:coenzyme F420-reducing hydrogenase delta subunit